VTNEISGTVSVIDVAQHAVLGSIELPGASAKPVGIVVSPDSRWVYVATGGNNAVAVIDAKSARVLTSIPVGRRPWGIAMSPDGTRLYTANGLSNDVSVIDVASRKVVATIPAGERPWGIAIRR
jgi:YVTN family beta-propeller protein